MAQRQPLRTPTPDWWAERLLAWHSRYGRTQLPWKTTNPELAFYYALVSEYMLQQTQVKRVKEYFPRFIDAFADLRSLASATLPQVLACWSGLGYYRRANFLHQSAILLWQSYQRHNRLPQSPEELLYLPGIGKSTANAILAQSANRPLPILDANAKRVLVRLYGLSEATEKQLWQKATQLTRAEPAVDRAKDYCQAMMDFGSLVCSKKPLCTTACFAASRCAAYASGMQEFVPGKKTVRKKTLCLRLALVFSHQGVWLVRQQGKDLWPYTLMPPAAQSLKMLVNDLEQDFGVKNLVYLGRQRSTAHLSHRKLQVQALCFHLPGLTVAEPGAGGFGTRQRGWFDIDRDQLPLSSLATKVLLWAKTLVQRGALA